MCICILGLVLLNQPDVIHLDTVKRRRLSRLYYLGALLYNWQAYSLCDRDLQSFLDEFFKYLYNFRIFNALFDTWGRRGPGAQGCDCKMTVVGFIPTRGN